MKHVVRLAAAMLLVHAAVAYAANPAPANPQPAGQSYLFAVSEGTSGGIDPLEAVAKYRPMADVLQKILGRRVVVKLVRSFEELEAGMKREDFDFVMARPSDYPGRGVRDYKYSMVATSKPDGQCVFIVQKSSPLKSISDIKGKNIIFPEKVAYMTKFCSAELRDKGIIVKNENIKFAKEQAAVGWTVERQLYDVGGVASYSGVAKNWEKGGNRILHKSIPQPYSPLIAGSRVPSDRIPLIQSALANLDKSEDGKKILATLGIQGFNPESAERLLALLAWLEK